jgi:phage baseplate assembly protein W
MANGVSVLLPLIYSKQDGPFQLNKSVTDSVKQNFKNLMLTVKGERIMDPDFGVGIHSFLFENYNQSTNQSIISEANTQILKYMPFINLQEIKVTDSKTNNNQFYIYIRYSIQSLNILDELNFTVSR